MYEVRVELIINAAAEKVWGILIDVEKYKEWNPFTPIVNTSLKIGEKFTLDCQMNESKLLKDVPEEMFEFDPSNFLICWGTDTSKRKGVKGNRTQKIIPIDENTCKYVVYERFEGLLSPLVMLLYKKDLHNGFKKAAEALKKRAEN